VIDYRIINYYTTNHPERQLSFFRKSEISQSILPTKSKTADIYSAPDAYRYLLVKFPEMGVVRIAYLLSFCL